ncbi:hypothetical protein R3I93_022296 [Phoxinus phoxinus]|uniref:Ubiquitin-like domain-containing protein n=1 Tax=Phoxinus phoxinus TaxID=58324 RepID=A0AAN9C1V8_9TELE
MKCDIFIRNEKGQTKSVHVDSEEELENMTVGEFKRRFIPDLKLDQLRLIFVDRQLEDHNTLGDYGIIHKSIVYMTLRLRGGGPLTPEDGDKVIPRTESMEKLAPPMQQEESNRWCSIQ